MQAPLDSMLERNKNWRKEIVWLAFNESQKINDPGQREYALTSFGYALQRAGSLQKAIEVFEVLRNLSPKKGSHIRSKQYCLAVLKAQQGDLQECIKELASERVREFDRYGVVKSCLLEFVKAHRFELAEQLLQNDVVTAIDKNGNRVLPEIIKTLVMPEYLYELATEQFNLGNRDSSQATLRSAFEYAVASFQDWTLLHRSGKPNTDQIMRAAFEMFNVDDLLPLIPIAAVKQDDDSVSWKIQGLSRLLAEYGQVETLSKLETNVMDRRKPRVLAAAALGFACVGEEKLSLEWINRFLACVQDRKFENETFFAFLDCAKAAHKIGDSILQGRISNLILEHEYLQKAEALELFLEMNSVSFAEKAVEKMGYHDLHCERGKIALHLAKKGSEAAALDIMEQQTAAVTSDDPSLLKRTTIDNHNLSRATVANQWLQLGKVDKAMEVFSLIGEQWRHNSVETFGMRLKQLNCFNENLVKYEQWARSFDSPRLRAHAFIGLYRGSAESIN